MVGLFQLNMYNTLHTHGNTKHTHRTSRLTGRYDHYVVDLFSRVFIGFGHHLLMRTAQQCLRLCFQAHGI